VLQVSEDELRAVKAVMSGVFEKNAVKPGDPAYVYNLQRDFQPMADLRNDWDVSEKEEAAQYLD
jgi:hypothetical protein